MLKIPRQNHRVKLVFVLVFVMWICYLCPTTKLEDHFLSAVTECLLSILVSTVTSILGGRLLHTNPRMYHAVVTKDPVNTEFIRLHGNVKSIFKDLLR
jgi:hypothetical protein